MNRIKDTTDNLGKCSIAIRVAVFFLLLIIIFGVLLNFSSRKSLGYELVESMLHFDFNNIGLIKLLLIITLITLLLAKFSLYTIRILGVNCKHVTVMFALILLILISSGYFKKIKTGIDTYTYIHSEQQKHTIEKHPYSPCDSSRFIAHAGGMINGDIYTDSLEALNSSYENKFKFFELDILKTSDNKYVAAHDWDSWKLWSGYLGELPPTHKDFLSYKIKGKYTPLDMKSINSWFSHHTDATLVTDKVNNPKEFSDVFIDKKRLIMELFTMESVIEGVKNKVTIMPAWNLVEMIQSEKLKVLNNLGVQYISANEDDLRNNRKTFSNLINNGLRIYVYGSNNGNIDSTHFYGKYIDSPQPINECFSMQPQPLLLIDNGYHHVK